MNKKGIRILIIAVLCFALFSAGYAWYRNNRETDIYGSDSIQIKGNGVMLTAFSTNADGNDISESAAAYKSELAMELNGKYMDVSGDGISIYTAELDSSGVPKEDEWISAGVDSASNPNDSGKYVVADVYFKSDEPMDIYLMGSSAVTPVSDDNGNDLVNKGSHSGKTRFDEFNGGLPPLNINQSAYGLFSRNLIAGATRVAFSEYSYNSGWEAPANPNLVWVPNSKYQLNIQTSSDLLYTVNMNGTKEQTYQYYNGSDGTYIINRSGNQLAGKLSIKKTSASSWEDVTDKMISSGLLIPARIIDGASSPIPQIWLTDSYSDAAYCEAKECFVKAEYADNWNINNYAYVSVINNATYYVMKTDDGYAKCEKKSGNWVEVSPQVLYTDSTSITTTDIEAGFQEDTAEYQRTYWMEDDDFTSDQYQVSISKYKLGSTKPINSSGSYYTRIKMTIWVEGYDRESNIALNAGEFDISLKFYGVEKQ